MRSDEALARKIYHITVGWVPGRWKEAAALIASARAASVREAEDKADKLHDTRRDIHIALSKAGIRSHYFIGDDERWPLGREVGAVERVEMLVDSRDRLREELAAAKERVRTLEQGASEANRISLCDTIEELRDEVRTLEAERDGLREDMKSLLTPESVEAAASRLQSWVDTNTQIGAQRKALDEARAALTFTLKQAQASILESASVASEQRERAETAEDRVRTLEAAQRYRQGVESDRLASQGRQLQVLTEGLARALAVSGRLDAADWERNAQSLLTRAEQAGKDTPIWHNRCPDCGSRDVPGPCGQPKAGKA